MRLIGLIPARGGSKGIPGKNLAPCAGRPLIAWTCEAAIQAKSLARVCVSTDDVRIAEQCRQLGVEVPFMRPAALAGDATPSLDVMRHFLDWLEAEGGQCDGVMLLQPTSPLRTARHVDAAAAVFSAGTWDSLVSVVAVEHRYLPEKLMRVESGAAVPMAGDLREIVARQAMGGAFARNGPAILISGADTLRSGSLYGSKIAAFVMPRFDSADVDNPEDLLIASALLEFRQKQEEEAST